MEMKEKHKLQIPHFGVKNHSYEIGKILEDFHYTVIIHDQEYFMSVQIELCREIKFTEITNVYFCNRH